MIRNIALTILNMLQMNNKLSHTALSDIGRIRNSPAEFYNGRSRTFLKNKRKGH